MARNRFHTGFCLSGICNGSVPHTYRQHGRHAERCSLPAALQSVRLQIRARICAPKLRLSRGYDTCRQRQTSTDSLSELRIFLATRLRAEFRPNAGSQRRPHPCAKVHLSVLPAQTMGRGCVQKSARSHGKLHQKTGWASG